MLSVLRVSSYPSRSKPGMGFAPAKLASDTSFATLYRAPLMDESDLEIDVPKNVNFKFYRFPNIAMPKKRRGMAFLRAVTRRIFALLIFYFDFLTDKKVGDIDIVHIHSPMYIGVAIWGKLRNKKTYLTIHGTDFYRVLESPTLRKCMASLDKILCVSDEQRKVLSDYFPESKLQTISNGVDIDFYTRHRQNFPERQKKIVTVGTLRWHKNHPLLIKSFAAFLNGTSNDDGWVLEIIGDGPDKSKLQELITDLKLERRVRLVGSMSRQEVAQKFGESQVFALSSETEGLPKALLEAMASGCSCISTDVGDCKAVLGDSGIVVPNNDLEAFSDGLKQILLDDKEREMNGNLAVTQASKFGWESYCLNHHLLYQQHSN